MIWSNLAFITSSMHQRVTLQNKLRLILLLPDNAVSLEGVEKLVQYLEEYAQGS